MRNTQILVILLSGSLFLSACSTYHQGSSGEEYLGKYEAISYSKNETTPTNGSQNFEKTLREIASVEPVLQFPAKLGIARIERGKITQIPANEMQIWGKMRDSLGESFGEIVPLNPIIAEMVADSVDSHNMGINSLNKVRLGAARQHMDAVIIYEVVSKSQNQDNWMEIGNLTIVGMYVLPSETVESEGYASAILIDVLQGYPYGTADIAVEKQKGFTVSGESSARAAAMEANIKATAVQNLAPQVETLIRKVRKELEAKRAQSTPKETKPAKK